MNKIITSDVSDIDLDPESMTDPEDSKQKRLDAIRDLEAMLDNAEVLINSPVKTANNTNANIECVIGFKSKISKNSYVTTFNLSSLNQTIVERNITEVEINGDDKKLIQLFSFYQNNIYKEKRVKKSLNGLRVLLQKKSTTRRKKKLLYKNDVYVSKFYAKVKNKKIDLLDVGDYIWKVNEMKYSFDNNRSIIKMLLVRTK